MDAQTVLDNVNKYRYGVLIGNSTEERFGFDMANRDRNEKLPNSTMKDSYGLQNSAFNNSNQKVTQEEKEFTDHVKFNKRGVQNHLLVGHGIKQDHFEKKHFGTTYDLSFNQQITPQTQINSKFDADMTAQARMYDKNRLYEKSHQEKIPEVGGKAESGIEKHFRAYDEYTKTFDATHYKIPFRK